MSCFLIPTSTTVIQPEQPIINTSTAPTSQTEYYLPTQLWLADQLTKLNHPQQESIDVSLGPLDTTLKTQVPSLQDKDLKARVIQEAVQAERNRKKAMMLKARGKVAQLAHKNATEGRPMSAVFLAPERAMNKHIKLTINEPANDSELHRPPSIEFVKKRVLSSKLDKHISEYPEYQEALANRRQQRRADRKGGSPFKAGAYADLVKNVEEDLAKTAPHLLDNTRFKQKQKNVESYIDTLSQTPLQKYKSIGGVKDTRPSSCFLSSEREKYAPSLAYRQNKTESELKAPKLITEMITNRRKTESTNQCSPFKNPKGRCVKDSPDSIPTHADAVKKLPEDAALLRGPSNERAHSTELSASDKFMKDMAMIEQKRDVPKQPSVPTTSQKSPGTRIIASRSVSNHRYKSNERSISPWKEWRIKNSLAIRQPEIVMEPTGTGTEDSTSMGNPPVNRVRTNHGKEMHGHEEHHDLSSTYNPDCFPDNANNAESSRSIRTYNLKSIKPGLSARYESKSPRRNALIEKSKAETQKDVPSINQDRPIDRKLVAALRQEHVKKLGAGRSSAGVTYSPSRHTTNLIMRAKQSAFCLEDEEISTSSMRTPSPGFSRLQSASDPRGISVRTGTMGRIKDQIPIHDKIKYKSTNYIPDYSKTSGRDQPPGYRHLCTVNQIEAPRPESTKARAISRNSNGRSTSVGLQYQDMQGLLYTPAGLPIPKSLMCMLSDNILNNIKEVPAAAITANVDGAGALLATCDGAEYKGVRRFSAKKPVSVNDLKASPGRNHVPMSQQSPRSRPITRSGMRYDTGMSPEPYQPVVDTFEFKPNAEATIEEANIERRRYNMIHPSLTLVSKMPVTGREIVPGKMAAYMLTNLNVPTSTMIAKVGETQAGKELYKPIISTSHFDYSEQLNIRDAGAYIKPRVKVPRMIPDQFEGSVSDAGRLGLDLKIGLLDPDYMQSSKFYDKTHIDDCFKSVASSPCFSLQTSRSEFSKKGSSVAYKVNYSAVEPRTPGTPALAKQPRRFK